MDVVWFILIGLTAGWLAGQIMAEGYRGWVGDLVVGVIGAVEDAPRGSTLTAVENGGGWCAQLCAVTSRRGSQRTA